MQQIKINKQQIITSVFIFFCLAGYTFFPTEGYFQYRLASLVFLLLVPFLYNKYFLRKSNFFKKITIGDWKNSLKFFTIGLLSSILIMVILFQYTDLLKHYLLSPSVKNDFIEFLIYEFTGIALTVAVYEIFFRGFVMFYFVDKLQKWAILVQFLFFGLMLLLINIPYWFFIGYLIFSPFAGWIAYKSNSMVYSFLGQLIFMIIFDASYIALVVK